eukprot:TRINITY_DN247_c0_g2_i2.p1 TRINITY_DN247_c0_g2~~TRINITY_DN247_c0_g2_i2.p1  ORF type:complete len:145 (-),score=33.15 TRINITY_DN247_c0_g2_i2:361-795(-)
MCIRDRIGSDGVIALAVGIAQNKMLKTLNLMSQNSRFGEASLSCIVKMFETNTTLTNIIWRLDSKLAWAITKCITRNREIERRVREGLSIDDIDPQKRKEHDASAASAAPQQTGTGPSILHAATPVNKSVATPEKKSRSSSIQS